MVLEIKAAIWAKLEKKARIYGIDMYAADRLSAQMQIDSD